MVKETIEDNIIFKKVGKKVVKAQTDRIKDQVFEKHEHYRQNNLLLLEVSRLQNG